MKYLLTLLVGGVSFLSLYGQASYVYALDPAFMLIEDETTGDSTFFISDAGNITTQGSFRVKLGSDKGSIRLRALDNPILTMRDQDQQQTIEIFSRFNGSGSAILMSDLVNGDTNTIRLVTNYASTNDARIITDELQINGGADLAEMFDLTDPDDQIRPGQLVSIDVAHPGKLHITREAYDTRIAGIVAGANGVKPGILMGQQGSSTFGDDLITLSGRTYVLANTLGGEIHTGDLLTSSSIPGEAMRAHKKRKARGAIIGKAMTPLSSGSGYVLVLVNLQ